MKTRVARRLLAVAVVTLAAGCITRYDPLSLDPDFPIERVAYKGWQQAILLDNGLLEIVVVPELGRIMRIGFKGEPNILRNDPAWHGRRPTEGTPFINAGGDWLWPAAQSRWTELADGNWPPPAALADGEWIAQVWTNDNASQSCLLMRRYGDPVHTHVSRLITLDPDAARIRISQRMIRIGPSDLPVSLWSVTQVDKADRAYLPVDETASAGYRPLLFDAPPESLITRCGYTLVYNAAAGGEHKIGVNGAMDWIAAESGPVLIVQRLLDTTPGSLPDGGCAIELYSNTASGYVEIETLSPEMVLAVGESLENRILVECHYMPKRMAPCEAAAQVRDILAGMPATDP